MKVQVKCLDGAWTTHEHQQPLKFPEIRLKIPFLSEELSDKARANPKNLGCESLSVLKETAVSSSTYQNQLLEKFARHRPDVQFSNENVFSEGLTTPLRTFQFQSPYLTSLESTQITSTEEKLFRLKIKKAQHNGVSRSNFPKQIFSVFYKIISLLGGTGNV